MKRTNISIKKWQYEYLRERAEREDKSMSELIRNLIEQSAKKEQKQQGTDAIHDVVGIGSSGESDIARDHDQTLYPSDQDDA